MKSHSCFNPISSFCLIAKSGKINVFLRTATLEQRTIVYLFSILIPIVPTFGFKNSQKNKSFFSLKEEADDKALPN